jgi:hypothetical protein
MWAETKPSVQLTYLNSTGDGNLLIRRVASNIWVEHAEKDGQRHCYHYTSHIE